MIVTRSHKNVILTPSGEGADATVGYFCHISHKPKVALIIRAAKDLDEVQRELLAAGYDVSIDLGMGEFLSGIGVITKGGDQ